MAVEEKEAMQEIPQVAGIICLIVAYKFQAVVITHLGVPEIMA